MHDERWIIHLKDSKLQTKNKTLRFSSFSFALDLSVASDIPKSWFSELCVLAQTFWTVQWHDGDTDYCGKTLVMLICLIRQI